MRSTLAMMLLAVLIIPATMLAQPQWEEVHVMDQLQLLTRGSISSGDLDGDGDDDLAFTIANQWVQVGYQTPDGFVTSIVHYGESNYVANDLVDMDGDGDLDILVGTDGTDIPVYFNQPGNNWDPLIRHHEIAYSMKQVAGADMDNDGDMDIVFASKPTFYDFALGWIEYEGGNVIPHILYQGPAEILDLDVADADGDGDMDVLAAHDELGLELYTQGADGNFTVETLVNPGQIRSARFVDMNDDAQVDLLCEHSWFTSDGNSFMAYPVMGVGGYLVRPGDLDGDGDIDIATNISYEMAWIENTGTGMVERFGGNQGATYFDMAIGDFDSDGMLDVGGIGSVINHIYFPDGVFYYRNKLDAGGVFVSATLSTPGGNLIPAGGGILYFDLTIGNYTNAMVSGHAWSEVTLPNGNVYGPLAVVPMTLQPEQLVQSENTLYQTIPSWAPMGIYDFRVHVGVHPNLIVNSDSFEFRKTLSTGQNTGARQDGEWESVGMDQLLAASSSESETDAAPADWMLGDAYPNPFNPSTTLNVSLAEAAELKVQVFNINGQRVAELANGEYPAGTHTLSFNATNLASGVYFVQATVPGKLNELKKVMLVR